MHGQARERRTCRRCGTALSSYNREPLCFRCDEQERQARRAEATRGVGRRLRREGIVAPPGAAPGGGSGRDTPPNLCGEKVVDLANQLLRDPQRWGLIGVEYVFFHQFFNEPLQLELKQLRRQLYGQEDPPMPMTLSEAEEIFGSCGEPTLGEVRDQADRKMAEVKALEADWKKSVEQLDGLSGSLDREELAARVDPLSAVGEWIERLRKLRPYVKKASSRLALFEITKDRFLSLLEELRAKGLLDGGSTFTLRTPLKILASPIADGQDSDKAQVFWQVAQRLDQLERALPTHLGSLYMALVCGTPPVPANVGFQWTIALGQPMVFRIYSAKARDISGLYRAIIEDYWGLRPRKHRATAAPDVETEWVEEGPLPYLKITLFPRPECIPTPSYVQRILRKEAAGKPFYDRRTKVFDVRKRIRTWATASLKLKCGMGNRDALRFWDAHCIHDRLRYLVEWDGARGSCTASQEVQFEQEIHHVLQRLATMGWQPLP